MRGRPALFCPCSHVDSVCLLDLFPANGTSSDPRRTVAAHAHVEARHEHVVSDGGHADAADVESQRDGYAVVSDVIASYMNAMHVRGGRTRRRSMSTWCVTSHVWRCVWTQRRTPGGITGHEVSILAFSADAHGLVDPTAWVDVLLVQKPAGDQIDQGYHGRWAGGGRHVYKVLVWSRILTHPLFFWSALGHTHTHTHTRWQRVLPSTRLRRLPLASVAKCSREEPR